MWMHQIDLRMINNFSKVKTVKSFFLILIIFFNFNTLNAEQFWSNKVDGPTSNEEAIKLLDGKKLDPIEGLWFTDSLGTLLIFKDKDIFKMYIVEGPTVFNGTWEAAIIKRAGYYDFIGKVWYTQTDGSYKYGTQSGRIEVYGNYFLQKYDSLSDQGANMDHKVTRIWPKDIYTHNNSIISDNDDTSVAKSSTEDELSKKFFALDWFNLDDPKEHYTEIPNSNSEVFILKSEIYIKGQEEIDKFSNILFGENASPNDMVIVDIEDYGYTIYIEYLDEGYISLKDWKDVDSNQFLKELKANAQEDIIDVQWVFEPKINENKNVTYSYKISWKDGEETLETKVLSLGRKGYHDIAVVKKIKEGFDNQEFEEFALAFANSVSFKDGFKHSDYKSGDKTAAVGIGGLVAGTLGVKALAKAGVIAKLLAFAVKFWWVLLAPLVFLGSLFNKKSTSGNTSEEKIVKKRKKRTKKTD